MKTQELVLPQNYVELTEDEMMYLDGGLSIPNWAVAEGINMGVGLAMSAIGGGGFVFLAKAVGKAALRGTITRALSRGLA